MYSLVSGTKQVGIAVAVFLWPGEPEVRVGTLRLVAFRVNSDRFRDDLFKCVIGGTFLHEDRSTGHTLIDEASQLQVPRIKMQVRESAFDELIDDFWKIKSDGFEEILIEWNEVETRNEESFVDLRWGIESKKIESEYGIYRAGSTFLPLETERYFEFGDGCGEEGDDLYLPRDHNHDRIDQSTHYIYVPRLLRSGLTTVKDDQARIVMRRGRRFGLDQVQEMLNKYKEKGWDVIEFLQMERLRENKQKPSRCASIDRPMTTSSSSYFFSYLQDVVNGMDATNRVGFYENLAAMRRLASQMSDSQKIEVGMPVQEPGNNLLLTDATVGPPRRRGCCPFRDLVAENRMKFSPIELICQIQKCANSSGNELMDCSVKDWICDD